MMPRVPDGWSVIFDKVERSSVLMLRFNLIVYVPFVSNKCEY
jgi:hypothetical protein